MRNKEIACFSIYYVSFTFTTTKLVISFEFAETLFGGHVGHQMRFVFELKFAVQAGELSFHAAFVIDVSVEVSFPLVGVAALQTSVSVFLGNIVIIAWNNYYYYLVTFITSISV